MALPVEDRPTMGPAPTLHPLCATEIHYVDVVLMALPVDETLMALPVEDRPTMGPAPTLHPLCATEIHYVDVVYNSNKVVG
jgi:hypothetical protein